MTSRARWWPRAQEGRRVYANIRRFLLCALSGGSAEIAVMLAGPLLGLALPLLPAQILWVNLLTHGLPGVALGSEPADPGAMRRPPRSPRGRCPGGRAVRRIARAGVVIAAVTLAVAVWGQATGRPWQSMAFLALGTTQLAVAVGSRVSPGTLGQCSGDRGDGGGRGTGFRLGALPRQAAARAGQRASRETMDRPRVIIHNLISP